MWMLGLIGRVVRMMVAAPVYLVILVLRYAALFVIQCSAWIFRLLAGILFLTTIACYLMGLEEGKTILQMLTGSFFVFLLPRMALLGVEGMMAMERMVRKFIQYH